MCLLCSRARWAPHPKRTRYRTSRQYERHQFLVRTELQRNPKVCHHCKPVGATAPAEEESRPTSLADSRYDEFSFTEENEHQNNNNNKHNEYGNYVADSNTNQQSLATTWEDEQTNHYEDNHEADPAQKISHSLGHAEQHRPMGNFRTSHLGSLDARMETHWETPEKTEIALFWSPLRCLKLMSTLGRLFLLRR